MDKISNFYYPVSLTSNYYEKFQSVIENEPTESTESSEPTESTETSEPSETLNAAKNSEPIISSKKGSKQKRELPEALKIMHATNKKVGDLTGHKFGKQLLKYIKHHRDSAKKEVKNIENKQDVENKTVELVKEEVSKMCKEKVTKKIDEMGLIL